VHPSSPLILLLLFITTISSSSNQNNNNNININFHRSVKPICYVSQNHSAIQHHHH
jgi:hypothetical protein